MGGTPEACDGGGDGFVQVVTPIGRSHRRVARSCTADPSRVTSDITRSPGARARRPYATMTAMADDDFRIEHDTMGEVRVPAAALYKAQTQRAVENFPISGVPIDPVADPRPRPDQGCRGLHQRRARACCRQDKADAIVAAAASVAANEHDDEFPIDVFQTGSGTSSNMNTNEVISSLAGDGVHPNDHVNASQSSNDVFPSAIHIAATDSLTNTLIPALEHLATSLEAKADRVRGGGEERPNPPDGRHPGHSRSGVRRLRRADPVRHRAHPGRPPAGRRAAARRHRRRHRHQHPARLRRRG